MTTIKEKIMYFVDKQTIKKEEFYGKVDISGANFRGKNLYSELSTEKTVRILLAYPMLSVDWLLFGKGEMIKQPKELKVEETKEVYCENIDYKEKYLLVLERYFQLSEELISIKSQQEKNKKQNSKRAKDATA